MSAAESRARASPEKLCGLRVVSFIPATAACHGIKTGMPDRTFIDRVALRPGGLRVI